MKKPFTYFSGQPRSRRAVALVVVLFSLVLITLIIIGLLLRAGTESRFALRYSSSASTRQLSDTVINLVQAQINHASSQGASYTWASQPGAIRLFNTDGTLSLIYKLYSSDALTTATASALDNDLPGSSWASQPAVWTDLNAPASVTQSDGTLRTLYPILDPRDPTVLSSTANIEGFALTSPPGASTAQPAPMAVRWLYMLQNGEIITPDTGSNGKVVTFKKASTQPSSNNPIVGRIAFWTDDETCKINVNTAGDGTFWDTPHYNMPDEKARAQYQPAQGEYQAYPGHPATTTLQKVYKGLFPSTALSGSQVFSLTPRYTFGGSQGGTVVASGTIPKKADRLYTSIEEMLFAPDRTPNGIFNAQQLDTARFFLTAHSSAPEVTLFGTPRVAIWPLHDTNDNAHRSAVDKLIAFCSTINGNPYYFTRSDPLSRTADISLSRNHQLLDYLDHFTSANIPGFSPGTFSTKYGASGNRQILTEIFDYIRIGNLNDPTVTAPYLSGSSDFTNGGGVGVVTPSYHSDWATSGFGRFPVLSEISMLFIGMGKGATSTDAAVPVDSKQTPGAIVGVSGLTPPANSTAVQGFLLINLFNPAHGFSNLNPGYTVAVQGLQNFTLNGSNIGMPSSAAATITNYVLVQNLNTCLPYTSTLDFRTLIGHRKLGQNDPSRKIEFYSNILPITGGTMKLGGGSGSSSVDLTVSIYAGNNAADSSKLVQTYTISFPSINIPVPKVDTSSTAKRLFGSTAAGWYPPATLYDRTDTVSDRTWINTLVNPTYDTVVSMVPSASWSDYRLFALASSGSIPVGAFTLHPSASATQNIAYSTRDAAGYLMTGATNGSFATDVAGVVSPTFNRGSLTIPPDWDNGLPLYSPGPYINKADEGTTYRSSASDIPYFDNNWAGQNKSEPTYFSANRQVPSPVMFGSLSTGARATPLAPWQTLLFRPGPQNHPGSSAPADHLLLDLFWAPVVEPYAISEPFATQGKINLNYQIVPFTYITRNTALRSALASEQVGVLNAYANNSSVARLPLNLSDTDGTLRQFKEKFASRDIFKSASEICNIYLVPSSQSWTSDTAARNAWYSASFAKVGDNVRERPYANLYPRLTTKSNCFKVFYRVQSLQNTTAANRLGQWDEDKGGIVGEQRGATTVERNIDPANTNIPDYASDTSAASMETFYRWRIVESTSFPQ